MNPVVAFAALSAASEVAGGIAAYKEGKQAAANDAHRAYLAETQSFQEDAARLVELRDVLSGIRAALTANGRSATSPTALALYEKANRTSTTDRGIRRGDYAIEKNSLLASAQARQSGARLSLLTGALRTGPSLYSIYDRR